MGINLEKVKRVNVLMVFERTKVSLSRRQLGIGRQDAFLSFILGAII